MRRKSKVFNFSGELWLYPGKGGWHFVTLEQKVSQAIRRFIRGDCAAWGSVRVEVVVAGNRWKTSIFPDRLRQSYLLPVKRDVRKAIGLSKGHQVVGKLMLSTGNEDEL